MWKESHNTGKLGSGGFATARTVTRKRTPKDEVRFRGEGYLQVAVPTGVH